MAERTETIQTVVVEDHPIYYAIQNEDKERVDEMIHKDPSVLAVSAAIWDGTPLIYAILDSDVFQKGNEMALHIIEHASNKYWDCVTQTATNNFRSGGMTALNAACTCLELRLDTVKALVERGADPTKKDRDVGQTPMSYLVWRRSREAEDIMEYLLSLPSVRETLHDVLDGDAFDSKLTYLGMACEGNKRSPLSIKLLMNAGADPTYPGVGSFKSPLKVIRSQKRRLASTCRPFTKDMHDEMKKIEVIEEMFQDSIDASIKARLFFEARFVADAAMAIPAALGSAMVEGMPPFVQRQRALEATPGCLQHRVQRNLYEEPGTYHDDEQEEEDNEDGDGAEMETKVFHRAVDELPDDLFDDLMELMVPPGDTAWKGEALGNFLKRLQQS
jgi:hypothetical protein